MQQKDSAEKDVRDIRRKTRRKFSAEEAIRKRSGYLLVTSLLAQMGSIEI